MSGKGSKHRSVLKRFERLGILKDKKLWDESKSVLGIPKVKMQKIKIKKEKAAAPAEAQGSTAAPAAAAPAPAKPTATAKAAPAAKPEKK
jgi:small basic protein (TIGR04137 family)